jgi:hypothetical protein
MPGWSLLLLVFVAWCLLCSEGQCRLPFAMRQIRSPTAAAAATVALPVVPIFPLILWGIANLIDQRASPWGTDGIGVIHALFGLYFVVLLVRDGWRLKRMRLGP